MREEQKRELELAEKGREERKKLREEMKRELELAEKCREES